MTPARFTAAARPLCAIALAAAALCIAACGGSTSTSSTAAQSADAAGAAALTHRAHRIARAPHDPVRTGGVVVHRPWPGTGGGQINDDNPGKADVGHPVSSQSDPCTLVSRADAQAIIGRPIDTPVDAPLGPTCIYRPAGARGLVTVTVESIDFASIESHIRSRKQSKVGGRTAYCGTYGQSAVFVPLAGGRVLTITAPCAIGVRFAAAALPRVKS